MLKENFNKTKIISKHYDFDQVLNTSIWSKLRNLQVQKISLWYQIKKAFTYES